jgi:hypothetical protein
VVVTDARYPEAWLNDRRILRLSDAAHRLYVTTLAWCVSNRTDGVIDRSDLALIHGVDPTKADELVAAGLWTQVTDGWRIVDFHKTQTTKTQLDGLDHKRHMDRERKARERARKKERPESVEADLSRVTSTVTSDVTQRQDKARQAVTGEPPTTEVTERLDARLHRVTEPLCVEFLGAARGNCHQPAEPASPGSRPYCREHKRTRVAS